MQIFIEEIEVIAESEVQKAFIDAIVARSFIVQVDDASPRFAVTNDPSSFIRLFEAFADASLIDSLRSSSGSLRSPSDSLRSSMDSLRSSSGSLRDPLGSLRSPGLIQLASQIASIFFSSHSSMSREIKKFIFSFFQSLPSSKRSEEDRGERRLSAEKDFAEVSGMIVQKKEAVKHKMKSPKEPGIVKITYDQIDLDLAAEWVTLAKAKTPWREYDSKKFATAIAETKRKVKITNEQMRSAFEWIKKDEFWINNAYTPMGLLKVSASNGLRKIDNILSRMRQQYIGKNQVLRAEEKSQYDTDTTELDFYRSLLERERNAT